MIKELFDKYTIELFILIIFSGVLILLERIFSISIEGFFYALLPTIILILFYILIHRKLTLFEDSIKDLLETHIPDITYLDKSATIKAEFIEAVNNAEKYIMTTGGKSRMIEYLSTIETILETREIEYYRIISGEKISNELYNHLSKIIGNVGVYISITPHHLPTFLLTEKIAFIALPDPKPDEFNTCLKIPHEKMIGKLERYIRIWYSQSETIRNKAQLEAIRRY